MKKILISIITLLIVGCGEPALTEDQVEAQAKILLNRAKTEYNRQQYEVASNTLDERKMYIHYNGWKRCSNKYKFLSVRWTQCANYWDNIEKEQDKNNFWSKVYSGVRKEGSKAIR